MKLTQEERELIKAEYSNFTEQPGIEDIWTSFTTEEVSDFWLSKIDTILEERVHEIMEYIDSRADEIDTVQDWEKIKLDILNKSSLK